MSTLHTYLKGWPKIEAKVWSHVWKSNLLLFFMESFRGIISALCTVWMVYQKANGNVFVLFYLALLSKRNFHCNLRYTFPASLVFIFVHLLWKMIQVNIVLSFYEFYLFVYSFFNNHRAFDIFWFSFYHIENIIVH